MRNLFWLHCLLTYLFLVGINSLTKAQSFNSVQDSIAVFRLLNQADLQCDVSNFDSALSLVNQATTYSRHRNYLRGEAWSRVIKGDVLILKDALDEAEKNSKDILRLGQLAKDSILIAIASLHKAQVRMYKEEYDSAVFYYNRSLHGGLDKARNSYTALAYNDLGFTWGRKEVVEKMTEYCLKSLSIYELLNDPTGCAMALGNISTVYYELNMRDKAVEYGKRSLVYREKAGNIDKLALACCNLSQTLIPINLDEALKYRLLCEKYAAQSKNEFRLRHAFVTASLVANAQRNNAEAYEYELKTIASLEKEQDDQPMLARRYIAAAFYTDLLKQDTAITLGFFKKSINISKQLNHKANLRDVYRYMSDFYMRQKDFYQAYNNYRRHVVYKDSLALSAQQNNIAELETKYQTTKKDAEIGRLSIDQRIKLLEIEKQKATITGNHLEAQRKENEINLLQQEHQLQSLKLKSQEEELAKQSLLAKNKEQELSLVQKEKQLNETQAADQERTRNVIIGGVVLLSLAAGFGFSRYQVKKKLEQHTIMQSMRNNIASDLHDDIGASLSNINILNELTRRNASDPKKVDEYLSKASEDIRQVSEGISDIVWNINPRFDDLEHLFVRMKRYAADILDGKNINYNINFPEQTGEWKMDMDKRRDLYLLFKEAVNNLAKYSNASRATIDLTLEKNNVHLTVEDNGVGFDTATVKQGNGLQNMRERAALLKGNLLIDSYPGKGTRLALNIPV